MSKRTYKAFARSGPLLGGAVLLIDAFLTPGLAQSSFEEIVVTARKREETSLSAPVVLTAVGLRELERRQITTIDALARIVPQLLVAEGGGSVQGGIIVLRGIGSGENNPLIDQAVSFNIDGVQVAKSSVRRLAEMDLQQVEVLKGPQALFFGKNSPGGIISMRSADPTKDFRAQLSIGYEFNAEEKKLQGFVSGPITSKLGGRIAFYADHAEGWMENRVPRDALLAPQKDIKFPRNKEYGIRGTLKYDG